MAGCQRDLSLSMLATHDYNNIIICIWKIWNNTKTITKKECNCKYKIRSDHTHTHTHTHSAKTKISLPADNRYVSALAGQAIVLVV